MAVEIELRARFDAETHARLTARLAVEAEDLGADDKHIHFYVLPDKLLKVTDNRSHGTAKISLKAQRIGQGTAFPETEFGIHPAEVERAVQLLDALGFGRYRHEAFNQRHNYRFLDVEIALKWSEAWGYHAEFEVLLEDDAEPELLHAAEARIRAVAAELRVSLMSEDELAAFTQKFEDSLRHA